MTNQPYKQPIHSQLLDRIGVTNLYFFKKCFFATLGYLALFSAIIILVDMMVHIRDILDHKTQLVLWSEYYVCLLAKRLDVLIPFSIGIATVHILTIALKRCEFIPLLCSGQSLITIIKPFFISAVIFALITLCHYQYILPKALPALIGIENSDFGRNKKEETFSGVGQLLLADGSRLLFGGYSKKKHELQSLFLLTSMDSMSYMNSLKLDETGSEAHFLQEFKRDASGSMRLSNSYTSKLLPNMGIDKESLLCATAPPKELSLRQLLHIFPRYWESQSERAIDVHLSLFQKITQPFLCLLAACIPMLTAIQFGRRPKSYALFITAALLMLTQIVLQAFSILARTSIITPITAVFLPWIAIGFIAVRQLKKLVRSY